MQPLYFKETADGPWKEWVYGNLDGRALKKRDPVAVTINHVSVHTLQFGPYDEWTCEHGKTVFTPPPEQEQAKALEPDPTPEPTPAPVPTVTAQEYAMRVWNGQSVSLGLGDRRRRVRAALEGQGLSMDGVKLPGDSN